MIFTENVEEAPEHMKIQICEDILREIEENPKRENVLLLAMSTLPKYIKENSFFYEKEGDILNFTCKSQLAPETECIMKMLSCDKKVLDRIVVLGSKEAFEDIHETVKQTAYNYYKDEIISFVNKESDIIFDGDKSIIGIKMYEPAAFLKAIDSIKGQANNPINLYIDVQGGKRSETTAMIAITELLRRQNVTIKGRYANDFSPSSSGPYRIHTVDEEYNTFELVTAMTEFNRYGRGEGLKVYFEGREDEFAKQLADAINNVAQSIQLCDMDRFGNAIRMIGALHNRYDEASTSDVLSIIYKDIMGDYKSLISSPVNDYVTQIEWCINKGFIQQALTIIESKMPEKIVGTEYFKVDFSEKTDDTIAYTNGEIIDRAKQPWEQAQNFILRKWAENTNSDYNQTPSGIKSRGQAYYLSLDGDLQNSWEIISEGQNVPGFGNINIKLKTNDRRYINVPVEVKNDVTNEIDNKKFCLLMKLHMALREQRNNVNHVARGQRESADCVIDAIKAYIDIARILDL